MQLADPAVCLNERRAVSAVAPVVPATVVSLVAALPANAVGSGAELARPSTAASVQSAVKSAPSVLESNSVDQAVNSVVDVVKVTSTTTYHSHLLWALNALVLSVGRRRCCQESGSCSRQWPAVCAAGICPNFVTRRHYVALCSRYLLTQLMLHHVACSPIPILL